MLAPDSQGMLEELTLDGTGMLDLVHHPHIHLLPEAGDTRHTGGMRLTHRLLHLLRMGVDDHRRAFRQGEYRPATLKDMRIRQEIHHTVVLIDRHTLVVCLKGGMEHPVGKDDTLGVARGATGIKDVGDIVERSLFLTHFHLRLTGQVLA